MGSIPMPRRFRNAFTTLPPATGGRTIMRLQLRRMRPRLHRRTTANDSMRRQAMSAPTAEPIIILGAGPAGMASAPPPHTAAQPVVLLERYPEARPAGNILNLWPPPIKALRA